MRLAAFTLVLAFAAFLVHGAASSILSRPAALASAPSATAKHSCDTPVTRSLSRAAVLAQLDCI